MAKVSTDLPEGMQALFDQCLDRQIYGGEAATVRAFILLGLESLLKEGRLLPMLVPEQAKKKPTPNDGKTGKE